MALHPAEQFINRTDGPFAIAAGCKLCRHIDVVRKPPQGMRGRGWGMREGNKQRGRMIQHVKAEHPEAIKQEAALRAD